MLIRSPAFWLVFALIGALVVFNLRPAMTLMRVFLERNQPAVSLPERPVPKDPGEARLQDLDDLAELPKLDRSFTPETRQAFEDELAFVRTKAIYMSPATFAMEVSRLVAMAGNAHTTVNPAQRARRFRRIPLRFAWFSDGLRVVRAAAPFVDLLGARVAAINGQSVDETVRRILPFVSGTEEHAQAYILPILESPSLLKGIWPGVDEDRLELRLALPEGIVVDRFIQSEPVGPDPFAIRPMTVIGPTQVAGQETKWSSVLKPDANFPLSLRDPDRSVFPAPLEEGGLYVRLSANQDDDKGPLRDQLAAILNRKPADGWRWIVLDLRFNNGGDVSKAAEFSRRLPDMLREGGSIWILTGNATFSAAIVTAARVKYYGGDKVHIVGEKVGDRGQFWAEGGAPLVLRNSGIAVFYADFMYDWENGCNSLTRCYPLEFLYGVAVGDLSPQETVAWKFSDYAEGRDTVLERVRELALGR